MIEAARTWLLLRDLRRSVRASPETQRERQGRRLAAAVAHAYRHVPFYRRLWSDAGVCPDDIRGVGDLPWLPVVGADDVRAAMQSGELLARTAPPGLPRFPTTGSSGEPLLVPRGNEEARRWRAGGLHLMFEHGARWSDPTLHFESQPGQRQFLQWLGVAPSAWIAPTAPVEDHVELLRRTNATMVFGTPTVLRRVCRELGGCEPGRATQSFCQGEILDGDSRETIRAALGADPISVYGTTEAGYIAWQCERRGTLHVNTEMVVVETLCDGRAAAPGELGRVVVTDLIGRAMPLLRCDTGDLTRVPTAPCACARTLPTIGAIEGRARQVIALDGRVVTTSALLEHMRGTVGVGDYQLRQDREASFTLSLASGVDADAARARLRGLLGDVEVHIASLVPGGAVVKTHVVTCYDPGTSRNSK